MLIQELPLFTVVAVLVELLRVQPERAEQGAVEMVAINLRD
jgi:hypothetical protein